MIKKLFFSALATALLCPLVNGKTYSETEYNIRPWEIIKGLQPHSKLLWDTDNNGIDAFNVSSNSKLTVWDKTKLWGDTVTRIDLPASGSVTLRLKNPIEIKSDDGNGLDLWIYGPAGSRPKITFTIKDAANMTYRFDTNGLGSSWAAKRWWGLAAGLLPAQAKFPVKLTAISITRLTGRVKDDFLCIDRLGVYTEKPVKMADSSKTVNPFPLNDDGIMPIGMKEGAANSVSKKGNQYVFAYQGKDATINYTYVPKTGTLGDLSVTINGETFRPAAAGGIRAQIGQVKFMPSDTDIQAKLVKESFDGKKLHTLWQWQKENAKFDFELNFSIKGKSLAVEVKSLSEGARAFDPGKTENTVNPRLFGLTYLHNRWEYPHFMVTDKYFMSVLCDWYFSNASELWEGTGLRGLDKAEVFAGKNSARIMPGTVYFPKTDGSYNPLYERVYFTVSPELYDVMPHINNPPSRFLKETANLVCSTRSYPLQGNAKHADMELAMWQKLYDYGVTDTYVRTHTGLLRTPIESNNIAYQMEGSYYNGGDATVIKLIKGMVKLTKRFGLYGDNRVVTALNSQPYFTFGALSKNRDNTYAPGCDNTFRPKPSVQLEHQKLYVTGLLKKYPELNAQYMDELTNAPPWADTDYDYLAPGAGTFAAVLRDYGLVALQQKELFNGPVWSEGCAAYFWAGLMDIDYAVSNDTKANLPLIVDFKLTRMNKLSSFTGTDWPIMRDPKVPIDRMLANEIACGNIGHLGLSGEGMMPWQGAPFRLKNYAQVLQSYFMIRQVQEYYAGQSAAKIKYDIDGKLMTASEMLKGNHKPSGKIHAVYPSGLQTWVNYNAEGEWTVNVEGEDFTLPPYGHAAIVPDELLQYIAVKDGHTVSYSRGKYFTYLDGRGEMTEFPEMTAANAYVMRQIDGKTRITPAPFKTAETIKGLSFNKATPLKQDGSKLAGTMALDVTDAGMGDLTVDGKAFHYTME